jgi:uncharacterized protein (TIGR02466 family)
MNDFEKNVLCLFPIPIYMVDDLFSNEELLYFIELSKEIEKNIKRGGKNWQSQVYNTLGTYNLVNDVKFKILIDGVTKQVENFNNLMNSKHKYLCEDAWINSYKKGDYQELHNHAGSTYSAVLFLKCPDGSAPIIFHSPSDPYNMLPIKKIEEHNVFNTHNTRIYAKENSLVIFRSYLYHRVSPNNSDERISIAFNF